MMGLSWDWCLLRERKTIVNKGCSRTTCYLVLIVVLTGLVWLLFAVRALIGPLVIAALLAYVLNPAVTLITARTKLSHRLSVSLVYLLFLGVLVALLVIFVPVVVSQAKSLSLELQGIEVQLEDALASPTTFLGFDLSLDELLVGLQEISSPLLKPERVLRVLKATTTNLAWILVILVTTYYFLRDWERLREWLIRLAPEAYQSDIRRLHKDIQGVWQAYLRGQLLLMLVVGVLTGLGSAAVGLPGAVALGLLAGALDLVPSLGPTVAMVVAALIAWFEGSAYLPLSNTWFTVVVIALYNLVQLLENIWLQPRIMGRSVRLHPGLVFVAVVGALTLMGMLAALIIVPLVGSARVVGRYVHRRMLGLEPWPEAVSSSSYQGTLKYPLSGRREERRKGHDSQTPPCQKRQSRGDS
jgi:predicted PurR-regulated permease PerM